MTDSELIERISEHLMEVFAISEEVARTFAKEYVDEINRNNRNAEILNKALLDLVKGK